MKTIITILMMSILLSVTYGQQSRSHFIQDSQADGIEKTWLIDHPDEILSILHNQLQNNKSAYKNPKQKLDSILLENYDGSFWDLGSTEIFQYDSHGNLVYNRYNGNSEFNFYSISEYIYDSLDKIIEAKSELKRGDDLISKTISEINYFNNDKHIISTTKYWIDSLGDFFNSYQVEMYYHENGYPGFDYDSVYANRWDNELQKWGFERKEVNSFFEGGSERIVYNYEDEVWVLIDKIVSVYDEHNYAEQGYNWELNTQQWISDYKYTEAFSEGNLDESYFFTWDNEAQEWLNHYFDEYSYNFDFDSDDLILPISEDLSYASNNMMEGYSSMRWSESLEDWSEYSRNTYYYSIFDPTGINFESEISTLQIYPNPARDILKVSMANSNNLEVEIYNIHGSLIKRQSLNSGDIIQIESLKLGIYLVKVKNGAETQTIKFIKK